MIKRRTNSNKPNSGNDIVIKSQNTPETKQETHRSCVIKPSHHDSKPRPKLSEAFNLSKTNQEEINTPITTDAPTAPNTLSDYHVDIYSSISVSKEEIQKIRSMCDTPHIELAARIEECYIAVVSNCYALATEDQENDEYKLKWIMSGCKPIRKSRDRDGHINIDLLIVNDLGEKTETVPISSFTENGFTTLTKYGIHVHYSYKKAMETYFLKLFEKMPLEDASRTLGIVKNTVTGKISFNAYKAKDGFERRTDYKDWEEYLHHFNQLLKPSTVFQYMLAATMAAPVMTILKEKFNYDLHSYCINAVGPSSTGKTISSRACAAAWTNPNSDKIYGAMHATANASLKRLDGRYGIPTFFDEATTYSGSKSAEFAYSVYNETEKARMSSDCTMRKSGTWSTIVTMTSEEHFRQPKKNQNGGLDVIVFSLESTHFTANADHAEKLSRFIQNNYGMIGYEFIKHITNSGLKHLQTDYEEAVKEMKQYTRKNKGCFTDRLVNIYALTYMTAKYLKEMGLEIDIDAVADIMANHNETVSKQNNMAKNAFEAIISYIARNPMEKGYREVLNKNKKAEKYVIEEGVMDKILTSANFKDVKVTIKEMDRAKYIIRQGEGKGLKSRLYINSKLCSRYQVDLSSLYEEIEEESDTDNKSSDSIIDSSVDLEEDYDIDTEDEEIIFDEEEE